MRMPSFAQLTSFATILALSEAVCAPPACVCGGVPPTAPDVRVDVPSRFARSDAVFVGEVRRLGSDSTHIFAEFHVIQAWKGVTDTLVRVRTAQLRVGSSCNLHFTVGEVWLVFADGASTGSLATSMCTLTERRERAAFIIAALDARPASWPATFATYDAGNSALRWEWHATARALVAAAEAMPDTEYAFRPAAGMRTFGEIISHVAATQRMLCAVALGERPWAEAVASGATWKAALVRELQQSMDQCTWAYAQDLQLLADNVRKDRYEALTYNTTHNAERFGNIAAYMMMKGLVPPPGKQ